MSPAQRESVSASPGNGSPFSLFFVFVRLKKMHMRRCAAAAAGAAVMMLVVELQSQGEGEFLVTLRGLDRSEPGCVFLPASHFAASPFRSALVFLSPLSLCSALLCCCYRAEKDIDAFMMMGQNPVSERRRSVCGARVWWA